MLRYPEIYREVGNTGQGGGFRIIKDNRKMFVLAASGLGWEHVSVSMKNRCPNWLEMCFIKDMFWEEDDCVMQLHPPKSEYVDNHPYCLHLWRPIEDGVVIPMPPEGCV